MSENSNKEMKEKLERLLVSATGQQPAGFQRRYQEAVEALENAINPKPNPAIENLKRAVSRFTGESI